MTAQPTGDLPDTGSYEVIHLGDETALVVPMADFLRLRALERQASVAELEDAEDLAALQEWRSREALARPPMFLSRTCAGGSAWSGERRRRHPR